MVYIAAKSGLVRARGAPIKALPNHGHGISLLVLLSDLLTFEASGVDAFIVSSALFSALA